jgi:hypothetical protein
MGGVDRSVEGGYDLSDCAGFDVYSFGDLYSSMSISKVVDLLSVLLYFVGVMPCDVRE